MKDGGDGGESRDEMKQSPFTNSRWGTHISHAQVLARSDLSVRLLLERGKEGRM